MCATTHVCVVPAAAWFEGPEQQEQDLTGGVRLTYTEEEGLLFVLVIML